ncbi:MAG: PDZ domain-containing protein [Planctomycetaceae bacterium]|nr:PDZ domain-containing protein [Planctomycetaceae bacterium]MBT7728346.1 PDZ domain-containing protein [Planctomycetaceae bacterium]
MYLLAAESPEKLVADDISIGEPLQIPLQSDSSKLSRDTDVQKAESPTPHTTDELTSPKQIATTTEKEASESSKEFPKTIISEGEEPADKKPEKKNSSKIKKEPLGSGWLGLIVDDSIITGRLVIVKVSDPSPAKQAGIKAQDVLLAIDGEPVQTADQLAALLAAISPDKQVRALIGRTEGVNEVTMTARTRPPESRTPASVPMPQLADKQESFPSENTSRFTQPPSQNRIFATPAKPRPDQPSITPPLPTIASIRPPEINQSSRFSSSQNPEPSPSSQVTLSEAPVFEQPPAIKPSGRTSLDNNRGRTALGVRTLPIDSATQARYRLPSQTGAYVFGVIESLPASNAGLPPGSVIIAFGNQPVRTPDELNRFVKNTAPGTQVSLQYVLPGGQSKQASVALQSIDPALEQALIGVPANNPPSQAPTLQTARRQLPEPTPSDLLRQKENAVTINTVLLQTEVQLMREEILRLRQRIESLEQKKIQSQKPYQKLL